MMSKREELKMWENTFSSLKRTVQMNNQWEELDKIKLNFLLDLLPPSGRTIEVGCGSARLSSYLAKFGYETFALDCSKEAIRVARSNYRFLRGDGDFIRGDAQQLPFRDKCFDVVMSTGLIEHFHDPSPVIKEMIRILKSPGLFYSDIVPKKFSLTNFARMILSPIGFVYKKISAKQEIGNLFVAKMKKKGISHQCQNAGLMDVHVVSDWVVPILHFPKGKAWLRVDRAYARLLRMTSKFWVILRGTKLGDWFGFLYYVYGRKDAPC